jgi:hypothetical protein
MPPKFLLTPNEQTSKDTPRSYRNQLIPETASDLLPKIIADASSFNYNTDPSYDEVRVIKVFEPTDPPKAGSSLALSTEFEQNKPPTISHCMAISVGKTHRNMPLPEEVGNNITDPKSITLTKMSMYCFDNSGVIKQPLKVGDKLPVHKISALEARITGIPTGNNITQAEADEISAREAAAAKNGGVNLGDYNNNSTGDGTQTRNNLAVPDGKCGNGSSDYPVADCKTASLDSSGQTITLHPVYWGKINDLLNQIKIETGTILNIGESIRSKQAQFSLRKAKCPAALANLGEERFKTERWSVILQNGPCVDVTPVGAISGPYASNHLVGLAVDFKMDVPCPASNKSLAQYEKCRATSQVFNLLNKYALGYGVINLKSEPWHWSSNGG